MKIFSTHHRIIGFGYLLISSIAVAVGTGLSLVMRLHLTWPDWSLPLHGPVLPEEYLALVTMHGTLMLFFVLTVAPQSGFGNLILPAQIGTRHMAFPRWNAAGMWLMLVALLVLLSAFIVPGGAPIGGWTAYPPLSESSLAGPGQGFGMDLWLASITLFGIAGTISAVNTLTTIVKLRCEGMTWERLPLTVWGWFTAAMLSVIAFSVLLAALVLLFCDRHLQSGFFVPANEWINGVMIPHRGDGSPLLWLHLFWFFGHPEVYIAVLPGMGLTSMVLANFARRRVFAYKLMIATTLLIGLLGILVWGHHMFVAGLNPFAGTVFSVASLAIAIPSAAKVLSWIATVWGSKSKQIRLTTPMLFALGFVSLFVTGGLSGPILAQPILDEYLHNTFFVVAHFHLIMAMAGVFGLLCATYYWYPLMFHRQLSEPLGKVHFWCTLAGAYATFLPMHLTGLGGEPRHYAQLNGIVKPANDLLSATMPMQRHITYSALLLAVSQVFFFWNILKTARQPSMTEENPWQATTLEWAPQPADEDELIRVYREPCQYGARGESFSPQWKPEIPLQHEAE
ncbi:cytochrome c oxidase subunit I [Granulicella paludicola]|uniref:cytochrome c oxidase subunit I n=1 Tax=Granulicella paludicola TaxID=474951 RepID=UPI0021E0987E|nr:cbb3-type cytochrome c oxidase subunit I [Granulicella paludicola]